MNGSLAARGSGWRRRICVILVLLALTTTISYALDQYEVVCEPPSGTSIPVEIRYLTDRTWSSSFNISATATFDNNNEWFTPSACATLPGVDEEEPGLHCSQLFGPPESPLQYNYSDPTDLMTSPFILKFELTDIHPVNSTLTLTLRVRADEEETVDVVESISVGKCLGTGVGATAKVEVRSNAVDEKRYYLPWQNCEDFSTGAGTLQYSLFVTLGSEMAQPDAITLPKIASLEAPTIVDGGGLCAISLDGLSYICTFDDPIGVPEGRMINFTYSFNKGELALTTPPSPVLTWAMSEIQIFTLNNVEFTPCEHAINASPTLSAEAVQITPSRYASGVGQSTYELSLKLSVDAQDAFFDEHEPLTLCNASFAFATPSDLTINPIQFSTLDPVPQLNTDFSVSFQFDTPSVPTDGATVYIACAEHSFTASEIVNVLHFRNASASLQIQEPEREFWVGVDTSLTVTVTDIPAEIQPSVYTVEFTFSPLCDLSRVTLQDPDEKYEALDISGQIVRITWKAENVDPPAWVDLTLSNLAVFAHPATYDEGNGFGSIFITKTVLYDGPINGVVLDGASAVSIGVIKFPTLHQQLIYPEDVVFSPGSESTIKFKLWYEDTAQAPIPPIVPGQYIEFDLSADVSKTIGLNITEEDVCPFDSCAFVVQEPAPAIGKVRCTYITEVLLESLPSEASPFTCGFTFYPTGPTASYASTVVLLGAGRNVDGTASTTSNIAYSSSSLTFPAVRDLGLTLVSNQVPVDTADAISLTATLLLFREEEGVELTVVFGDAIVNPTLGAYSCQPEGLCECSLSDSGPVTLMCQASEASSIEALTVTVTGASPLAIDTFTITANSTPSLGERSISFVTQGVTAQAVPSQFSAPGQAGQLGQFQAAWQSRRLPPVELTLEVEFELASSVSNATDFLPELGDLSGTPALLPDIASVSECSIVASDPDKRKFSCLMTGAGYSSAISSTDTWYLAIPIRYHFMEVFEYDKVDFKVSYTIKDAADPQITYQFGTADSVFEPGHTLTVTAASWDVLVNHMVPYTRAVNSFVITALQVNSNFVQKDDLIRLYLPPTLGQIQLGEAGLTQLLSSFPDYTTGCEIQPDTWMVECIVNSDSVITASDFVFEVKDVINPALAEETSLVQLYILTPEYTNPFKDPEPVTERRLRGTTAQFRIFENGQLTSHPRAALATASWVGGLIYTGLTPATLEVQATFAAVPLAGDYVRVIVPSEYLDAATFNVAREVGGDYVPLDGCTAPSETIGDEPCLFITCPLAANSIDTQSSTMKLKIEGLSIPPAQRTFDGSNPESIVFAVELVPFADPSEPAKHQEAPLLLPSTSPGTRTATVAYSDTDTSHLTTLEFDFDLTIKPKPGFKIIFETVGVNSSSPSISDATSQYGAYGFECEGSGYVTVCTMNTVPSGSGYQYITGTLSGLLNSHVVTTAITKIHIEAPLYPGSSTYARAQNIVFLSENPEYTHEITAGTLSDVALATTNPADNIAGTTVSYNLTLKCNGPWANGDVLEVVFPTDTVVVNPSPDLIASANEDWGTFTLVKPLEEPNKLRLLFTLADPDASVTCPATPLVVLDSLINTLWQSSPRNDVQVYQYSNDNKLKAQTTSGALNAVSEGTFLSSPVYTVGDNTTFTTTDYVVNVQLRQGTLVGDIFEFMLPADASFSATGVQARVNDIVMDTACVVHNAFSGEALGSDLPTVECQVNADTVSFLQPQAEINFVLSGIVNPRGEWSGTTGLVLNHYNPDKKLKNTIATGSAPAFQRGSLISVEFDRNYHISGAYAAHSITTLLRQTAEQDDVLTFDLPYDLRKHPTLSITATVKDDEGSSVECTLQFQKLVCTVTEYNPGTSSKLCAGCSTIIEVVGLLNPPEGPALTDLGVVHRSKTLRVKDDYHTAFYPATEHAAFLEDTTVTLGFGRTWTTTTYTLTFTPSQYFYKGDVMHLVLPPDTDTTLVKLDPSSPHAVSSTSADGVSAVDILIGANSIDELQFEPNQEYEITLNDIRTPSVEHAAVSGELYVRNSENQLREFTDQVQIPELEPRNLGPIILSASHPTTMQTTQYSASVHTYQSWADGDKVRFTLDNRFTFETSLAGIKAVGGDTAVFDPCEVSASNALECNVTKGLPADYTTSLLITGVVNPTVETPMTAGSFYLMNAEGLRKDMSTQVKTPVIEPGSMYFSNLSPASPISGATTVYTMNTRLRLAPATGDYLLVQFPPYTDFAPGSDKTPYVTSPTDGVFDPCEGFANFTDTELGIVYSCRFKDAETSVQFRRHTTYDFKFPSVVNPPSRAALNNLLLVLAADNSLTARKDELLTGSASAIEHDAFLFTQYSLQRDGLQYGIYNVQITLNQAAYQNDIIAFTFHSGHTFVRGPEESADPLTVADLEIKVGGSSSPIFSDCTFASSKIECTLNVDLPKESVLEVSNIRAILPRTSRDESPTGIVELIFKKTPTPSYRTRTTDAVLPAIQPGIIPNASMQASSLDWGAVTTYTISVKLYRELQEGDGLRIMFGPETTFPNPDDPQARPAQWNDGLTTTYCTIDSATDKILLCIPDTNALADIGAKTEFNITIGGIGNPPRGYARLTDLVLQHVETSGGNVTGLVDVCTTMTVHEFIGSGLGEVVLKPTDPATKATTTYEVSAYILTEFTPSDSLVFRFAEGTQVLADQLTAQAEDHTLNQCYTPFSHDLLDQIAWPPSLTVMCNFTSILNNSVQPGSTLKINIGPIVNPVHPGLQEDVTNLPAQVLRLRSTIQDCRTEQVYREVEVPDQDVLVCPTP